MPRKEDQKKRWIKKVGFEKFYETKDPWGVEGDKEEIKKARQIISLMKPSYLKGMDLGCGEGHYTQMYSKYCKEMLGCDISLNAIRRSKELYSDRIETFQFDIRKAFPKELSKKFDIVLCGEMLYYIEPEHYKNVIDNIYSLMSSKCQLIISAGHYFTEKEFKNMFSKIKFTDIIKNPSKGGTYSLIMSGKKY